MPLRSAVTAAEESYESSASASSPEVGCALLMIESAADISEARAAFRFLLLVMSGGVIDDISREKSGEELSWGVVWFGLLICSCREKWSSCCCFYWPYYCVDLILLGQLLCKCGCASDVSTSSNDDGWD